jgi:hypothetical protein
MSNDLKLPLAWRASYSNRSSIEYMWHWDYWSSSPNTLNKRDVFVMWLRWSSITVVTYRWRGYGNSVRCFKN